MKKLTESQAWKMIAIAFLRRASGERKFENVNLTVSGFCYAISELADQGLITYATERQMDRTVEEYVAWPHRGGNRWRSFRGMLALLLSYEAAQREAQIAANNKAVALLDRISPPSLAGAL